MDFIAESSVMIFRFSKRSKSPIGNKILMYQFTINFDKFEEIEISLKTL